MKEYVEICQKYGIVPPEATWVNALALASIGFSKTALLKACKKTEYELVSNWLTLRSDKTIKGLQELAR